MCMLKNKIQLRKDKPENWDWDKVPQEKRKYLFLSEYDSVFDMRSDAERLIEDDWVVYCFDEQDKLFQVWYKCKG